MASMYTALFRGSCAEPVEATEHFAIAIRHVNETLSKEITPTDSTIMVIVSLLVHANLTVSPDQARIHLNGLRLILNLRPGGFAALREVCPSMTQKICRADIEVSLVHGTATTFGKESPMFSPDVLPSPEDEVAAGQLPGPLLHLCPLLRDITLSFLAICRSMNAGIKVDGMVYQEATLSTLQQLLDFAPLGGPRPRNQVDDLWQLGLLAFVTTGLYKSGMALQSSYGGLLMTLLRDRLEASEQHADATDATDAASLLRLWLLIMYGLKTSGGSERSWFAVQTGQLSRKLGLQCWGEVRDALQAYPWIPQVHGGPGQRLWETVTSAD